MLHQVGLFFHIAAIIIVAGGSISGIMAENQLWQRVQAPNAHPEALVPIINTVPVFVRAGVILFLLSGLLMLYSVNWLFIFQPWFIAKLILFIMLPLRGALIAQPLTNRISDLIMGPGGHLSAKLPELMELKKKMKRFHIIQYTIVTLIVFLVVFKI